MTRVLAFLLVVLAAAGCGVRPSGVIPGLDAPAGPEQGTVPTLFFVLGDQVVAVRHPAPAVPGAPGRPRADLISLLAAGPDRDGRGKGLTTQVPARLGPATVTESGGGLDVRLHADLGGVSTLGVDQIVCTVLMQYPGASWVSLHGGSHTVDRRTCPVPR